MAALGLPVTERALTAAFPVGYNYYFADTLTHTPQYQKHSNVRLSEEDRADLTESLITTEHFVRRADEVGVPEKTEKFLPLFLRDAVFVMKIRTDAGRGQRNRGGFFIYRTEDAVGKIMISAGKDRFA